MPRAVTAESLERLVDEAVTAHIDRSGSAWFLGAWAAMITETIGRQASSRCRDRSTIAGGRSGLVRD